MTGEVQWKQIEKYRCLCLEKKKRDLKYMKINSNTLVRETRV